MAKQVVALIGGGKMGEALIKGIRAGAGPDLIELMVSDTKRERLDYLADAHSVVAYESNAQMVDQSEVLILAVKPQSIAGVLEELRAHIHPQHLVVSVAAGVPTRYIEDRLPPGTRVVRVMPNTPALVGQGMAGLCRGRYATSRDAETVRSLLRTVGEAVVVEEAVMDAITGLSGSGPAFVYMFIEALADGGVASGLARSDALALAAQTVKGAAAVVQQTGRHPGELKDVVASPGGTTMAGIRHLERSGFRSAVIEAVVAATARSAELAPTDPAPASAGPEEGTARPARRSKRRA